MRTRLVPFLAIGALGCAVQIAALYGLTNGAGWPYPVATVLAVELAVLHNFWWHERWTWRDRTADRSGQLGRLVRFHLGNGFTSIAGNVILTVVCVEIFGLAPVAANIVAVGLTSVANFLAADRWVFRLRTVCVLAFVSACPSPLVAADLNPETIAAWNSEASLAQARLLVQPGTVVADRSPQGDVIPVPGGSIHRWQGSTIVRGVTLDQLLDALMHPGTPPPQEDVLESRVLSRSGDGLRVYLKLVRRTIITVTYDTEHDITFHRWSNHLATSQSVATRIAETGGEDRGFLWRLNSYWRYTQTKEGVVVELESLSLSRAVPVLVRPMAAPLIKHVARESMTRTLEALRRHVERRYAIGRG